MNHIIRLTKGIEEKTLMKQNKKIRENQNSIQYSDLDLANRLFLSKRFKESIIYFDKILQKEPQNTLALNNKGYALSKSGNHKAAINCYDLLLLQDPSDITVLVNKISSLRKLKERKAALNLCDIILDKNPNYNVVLYHKERLLFSLKRYNESIFCCNKILDAYPNNGEVLFDKALSLTMLKKSESLEVLKKAIKTGKQFKLKARNLKEFSSLWENSEFKKIVS